MIWEFLEGLSAVPDSRVAPHLVFEHKAQRKESGVNILEVHVVIVQGLRAQCGVVVKVCFSAQVLSAPSLCAQMN